MLNALFLHLILYKEKATWLTQGSTERNVGCWIVFQLITVKLCNVQTSSGGFIITALSPIEAHYLIEAHPYFGCVRKSCTVTYLLAKVKGKLNERSQRNMGGFAVSSGAPQNFYMHGISSSTLRNMCPANRHENRCLPILCGCTCAPAGDNMII